MSAGAGLYFNYVFAAVDMRRDLAREQPGHLSRTALWIALAVHSFMAFLFFNSTVVVSGWVRWFGLTPDLAIDNLAPSSSIRVTLSDARFDPSPRMRHTPPDPSPKAILSPLIYPVNTDGMRQRSP